jgi:hypothetical protein
MRVEIELSEHHEAMLEELSELPDADPQAELGELLEPHAERAIHDAYQHHRRNGTL